MPENRTVLLAEDTFSLRSLMTYHLEDAGYLVIQAGDGREALRLYEEHRPWAVVTDYSMPEMNGLELARRIKELDSLVPVVLWTSDPPRDTAPADHVVAYKEMKPVIAILADLIPSQTST